MEMCARELLCCNFRRWFGRPENLPASLGALDSIPPSAIWGDKAALAASFADRALLHTADTAPVWDWMRRLPMPGLPQLYTITAAKMQHGFFAGVLACLERHGALDLYLPFVYVKAPPSHHMIYAFLCTTRGLRPPPFASSYLSSSESLFHATGPCTMTRRGSWTHPSRVTFTLAIDSASITVSADAQMVPARLPFSKCRFLSTLLLLITPTGVDWVWACSHASQPKALLRCSTRDFLHAFVIVSQEDRPTQSTLSRAMVELRSSCWGREFGIYPAEALSESRADK